MAITVLVCTVTNRSGRMKNLFLLATVTTENAGQIDGKYFHAMARGSIVVLVSRAGIVDFDALLDAAAAEQIRAADGVAELPGQEADSERERPRDTRQDRPAERCIGARQRRSERRWRRGGQRWGMVFHVSAPRRPCGLPVPCAAWPRLNSRTARCRKISIAPRTGP